jgi:molybdopterin-guanine dinucleotide biosynthesis protein B
MKAFGFVGYSGAGKTTLIERLVPVFVRQGLAVSLIKHAHAGFDIDRPGKDSFRLREAGCAEVLLTSNTRWALMHELRGRDEPTLDEQLAMLSPCDLVLVEGYKSSALPKLEVHRPSHGRPLMYPDNPQVIAVATDAPADTPLNAPMHRSPTRLDLNDAAAIAGFILLHQGFR